MTEHPRSIDPRHFILDLAGTAAAVSLSGVRGTPAGPHAGIHRIGSPEKVRFPSGDTHVVAHLYRPGDVGSERYPAVVVGGSLTAVKEQMGGIHAAELARRGFVTLSLDYRNYGESGGRIRQYEDPEGKAQDLVAALEWLTRRPDVRSHQLALLGVCTSGGTVLYAAAWDERIKAVACVASHFAEPAITPSLYGGPEGVERRRAAARAARRSSSAPARTT
jgi:dipeptidyl aminopeptidase/acylaminoacyl peptidase